MISALALTYSILVIGIVGPGVIVLIFEEDPNERKVYIKMIWGGLLLPFVIAYYAPKALMELYKALRTPPWKL